MVLQRVVEGEGNFGYNAATGEYGDLVEMGVLDPCKVTRTALQNAASIAGPDPHHRLHDRADSRRSRRRRWAAKAGCRSEKWVRAEFRLRGEIRP